MWKCTRKPHCVWACTERPYVSLAPEYSEHISWCNHTAYRLHQWLFCWNLVVVPQCCCRPCIITHYPTITQKKSRIMNLMNTLIFIFGTPCISSQKFFWSFKKQFIAQEEQYWCQVLQSPSLPRPKGLGPKTVQLVSEDAKHEWKVLVRTLNAWQPTTDLVTLHHIGLWMYTEGRKHHKKVVKVFCGRS